MLENFSLFSVEFCAPPRAKQKTFKIILEMDMTSTAEAAARSWYDSPRLGGGGGGGGSPHQTNGLGSAGSSLAHSHHSLSSGASSAGSSVGAALGGAGGAGGAGAGLGLDTSDMSAFYALESNGHHRRYYPSYHQHSKYNMQYLPPLLLPILRQSVSVKPTRN